MKPIDLTPARVRGRIASRRAARRWGAWLGGYAAVLGVVVTVSRLTLEDADAGLRARYDDATARRDQAENERAAVARQLEAVAQEAAFREVATRHPDWSVLLRALAEARGDDVRWTAVRLDAEPRAARTTPTGTAAGASAAGDAARATAGTPHGSAGGNLDVRVEGVAKASGTVFELAKRLEALGVFDRVRIEDTKPSGEGGAGAGTVVFTIRATVGRVEATR